MNQCRINVVDTPTVITRVDRPIRPANGVLGLPRNTNIGLNDTVNIAVVTDTSFKSCTVFANGPVYTKVEECGVVNERNLALIIELVGGVMGVAKKERAKSDLHEYGVNLVDSIEVAPLIIA